MAATNDFTKPDNTVSLAPIQLPVPSNKESRNSGGTADELPRERAKATFNVEKLIEFVDGGPQQTKRKRFIMSPTEGTDVSGKYYLDRSGVTTMHLKHFYEAHEEFAGKIVPSREDVAWMQEFSMLSGTMMNHYGLFLPTIVSQASGLQQSEWLPKTIMMKITGAYAQTELGHGSNVRGLRTTAHYDKATEEFVLNTPTLQSMKWWPGTLGKVANHAIVYAQLLIDGTEYGVHPFMMQIRDENHRPLPGIELGDLGTKMGDHANDTGFMRLDNVRIPRLNMLNRWQKVTKDGTYQKSADKSNDKVHYATMLGARGAMTRAAGGRLAVAVTIAIRYSCVRRQGFANNAAGVSYKSAERQIIDWQVQRYRLFKQLALAYALKFTGKWMLETFLKMESDTPGVISDTSALPEIAATAAGLKALSTFLCAQGIEECRKCCGGNGYLLNSGIAALAVDYLWQTTAEGDYIVLLLQTARFLIKTLNGVLEGQEPAGPVDYMAPLRDPHFKLEEAAPPPASSEHNFRNLDYLVALFRFRALRSVVDFSEQLKSRTSELKDGNEAWNQCAAQSVDAVKAHTSAFMLHKFCVAAREAQEKDSAVGAVLTRLAVLFALSNILDEQWVGVHVIGPKQLQMARNALSSVLEALRPDAVSLVDAFDIPDRVLCSTIGKFDGNVYEALYESALKSELNQVDPIPGWKEVLKSRQEPEYLAAKNTLKSHL